MSVKRKLTRTRTSIICVIPRDLADVLGFSDGDEVCFELVDGNKGMKISKEGV